MSSNKPGGGEKVKKSRNRRGRGAQDNPNTQVPQGPQDRGQQQRNNSGLGTGNPGPTTDSNNNSPRLPDPDLSQGRQGGQAQHHDSPALQGGVQTGRRGQASGATDAPQDSGRGRGLGNRDGRPMSENRQPIMQINLQSVVPSPSLVPSPKMSYLQMAKGGSNRQSPQVTPSPSAPATPRDKLHAASSSQQPSAPETPTKHNDGASSSHLPQPAALTKGNDNPSPPLVPSPRLSYAQQTKGGSNRQSRQNTPPPSANVTPRDQLNAASSIQQPSTPETPTNRNDGASSSGTITPLPLLPEETDKSNRPTPRALHWDNETISWLGYVKTLCQNVFRVTRENDASYDQQCREISNDLNIYQGYSRGREAIFPARPPFPTELERNIEVYANHFKMELPNFSETSQPGLPSTSTNSQIQFHMYSVVWQCESQGLKLMKNSKKEWWDEMVRNTDQHGMSSGIYDGGSMIISPAPFARDRITLGSNTVRSVEIKFNRILDWESCIQFLSQNNDERNVFPKDAIRALNMVMKEYCVKKGYFESGGFYYDKENHVQVTNSGQGVLILRSGYFQSVRALQGGLTFNLDVMSSAFYKSGLPLSRAWEGIQFYLPEAKKRCFGQWEPNREWNEEQVRIANEYWKNLQIVSSHRSQINEGMTRNERERSGRDSREKRFNIYQLEESSAEDTIVEGLYNTQFSGNLCEFIEKQYNLRKDNLLGKLPAIKLSKRQQHYLPWGCCKTTFDSRYIGKVEDYKLLQMMERNPQQRCNDLLNWMQIRYGSDRDQDPCPTSAEDMFKIVVEPVMMTIQALKLPRPLILARGRNQMTWYSDPYGDGNTSNSNSKFSPNPNFAFKSNLKVITPGNVSPWGILFFGHTNQDWVTCFLKCLGDKANQLGIHWTDSQVWMDATPINTQASSKERQMSVKKDVAMFVKNRGLNLIICFMVRKMSPEYATLKTECDIVHGVPTQVVLTKGGHLTRDTEKKMSTLVANVLLKINVKCGGVNFQVSEDYLGNVSLMKDSPKKIIFLGADVTHGGMCSIAAVVATTNSEFVEYACRLRSQDPGVEIIQDLKAMVRDLLQVYQQNQGYWPERILFFRDGVSESTYIDVLRYEGVKILEAAQEVAANYKPDLTIILAVKRHHTLFFVKDSQETWSNIRQGTVVDMGVTHPKDYDFFLCSHAPLKGTSHATHYYVLLDQNSLGCEDLYRLIYYLCHTYQRCTRSVSLVTPVYYSHLAAFRAKHYMESFLLEHGDRRHQRRDQSQTYDLNAHPNLRNRLWFL